MKHKWLKIGVCLLIIGLIGLAYMGTAQAKVNINCMAAADWQDSRIAGVGAVTQAKLLANAPYADIRDTAKIEGIGKEKQAQIERHFTTRDTCRWEDYILICASAAALTVIGALIIVYVLIRRRTTAETLTELIKR